MTPPKKKYHALIVEDNPLIVDQLSGFLGQTGLFEFPHVATTGAQAIAIVHDYPVDLLFLDMELPDMSGLDLLRSLSNPCPTVGISAFPTYAVDCYDYDFQDFLAKPLTYIRFLRSLRRTVLKPNAIQEGNPPELTALAGAGKPDYIYLKTGRINQRFTFADIVYLEAYSIYTKLFDRTGMVVINEQISTLADQLLPPNFLRVHKSYLINLDYVTRYSAKTIWLQTHMIPIGRKFQADVQSRLKATPVQESQPA